MIIDKYVEITITNSNYKIYQNLGYKVKNENKVLINSKILVNIEDISKGSHVKINCKCNYCNNITNIIYKN